MNIVHLLNQVSDIKGKIEHSKRASPQLMKKLRETLHHYGADAEAHPCKTKHTLTTAQRMRFEITRT